MNKSTKWIIVALIVGFVGLVAATHFLNQQNDTMRAYDTTTVIAADEKSGGIEETISGSKDAPAKLVVYTDYQCNNCADLIPDLNDLVKEYDGKLAIIYRIMVMSYHQNGRAAAAAALAAAQQGYWEKFKELLYTNQKEWASSDAGLRQEQFDGYFKKASDGKGDLDKFHADMESEAVSKKISFDDKLAEHDKVQWTPYLMFDGELVSQEDAKTRPQLMENIRAKVDAKLGE